MSFHKNEFAKSLAMHAMRARVVYMSMCQHANLPTSHFTCQRAKGVPIFNLAHQRAKRLANFSTSPAKRRAKFSTIFQKNF